MLKSITLLCALAQICLSQEFQIHATTLDGEQSFVLGKFHYDTTTTEITTVDSHTDVFPNDLIYCIGMSSSDSSLTQRCFSLLQLESPLHYNLVADINDNKIQKMSLVWNRNASSIEPLTLDMADAPLPPVIPLKKTTKTYADKRKEANDLNVVDDDKKKKEKIDGEDDEDDRNYLQKNWKQLLIGLVIYNVVTSIINPKKEESK